MTQPIALADADGPVSDLAIAQGRPAGGDGERRGRPRQPLVFTVPWTDGESSRYDVLGKDGATTGTASWTVRRAGDGWSLSHALVRNGKTEKSDVAMDARFHPLRSAVIIGVLTALSLVVMLALRAVPLSKLGISGEAAAQVADATSAFFQNSWYAPILGGLERVFAMTAHIGMSVLVMRAVTRRRLGYLLAATSAHAAMDGAAVWSVRTLGATLTEAMIALFAVGFLYLIYALREDPPAAPS